MDRGRAVWHLHHQCHHHPEASFGLGTTANGQPQLPHQPATPALFSFLPLELPFVPSHDPFLTGPQLDMNNDPSIHVSETRRKRSHQEMSRNPRSQTPYRPYEESSSSFATRPLALPTYPPLRAHGHEGYDFRRPVMATSVTPHAEEVIDLTNEPDTPPQHARPERRASRPSRPPRFGRNIITDLVDLEEDEHEAEGRQDTPINLDPPSPEDVQFVRANVRPPPPPPTRNRPFSARSSLRDFLRMRAPDFRGLAHLHPPPPLDMIWLGEEPRDGLDSAINLDLDVPFGLSFPPLVNNPPPRSTYKPPSPPPPGFTRNVKEEDVVVCPNCDAELGVGDEIKAQIWVAKPCGHVYCGECARNRSLSKAKKAVTKVKPFAKCQVEDCGKPVSAPKAMFQVYL